MNPAFFLELLQTKLEEKKVKQFSLVNASSTLEAAVAEIINEIHSCDLSKWTGNKSLLIGPSQGWRQGGGLWFSFQRGQSKLEAAGVKRNTTGASQRGLSNQKLVTSCHNGW